MDSHFIRRKYTYSVIVAIDLNLNEIFQVMPPYVHRE